MAKRMEADHSAVRLAQTVFRLFKADGGRMKSDQFVRALNAALSSDIAAAGEEACDVEMEGVSSSSPSREKSITGYNVRQRMKSAMRPMMKRLSKVAEDNSPFSPSASPGEESVFDTLDDDFVSITELKVLVEALDGMKSGVIDYTLLVAALLPPEAYCEDARSQEAFVQFDVRRRGMITPEDLQAMLRPGGKARDGQSLARFSEMVAEYDANGDGAIDLEEFRRMLRAGAEQPDDVSELTYTPMTEPTPCGSRASPSGPVMPHSPATSRPTPCSARPLTTPTPTPSSTGLTAASPSSKVLFASPCGYLSQ